MHDIVKTVALAILSVTPLVLEPYYQRDLQERISLELDGLEPRQVFGQLARILDREMSFEVKANQPILISAKDITVRTALDAMGDLIGCHWSIVDGKIVIKELASGEASALANRSKPIHDDIQNRLPSPMRFESVPLNFVLESIFKQASVRYCHLGYSASYRKSVTADVSNAKVEDALARAMRSAGVMTFKMVRTIDETPATWLVIVPPAERERHRNRSRRGSDNDYLAAPFYMSRS
jgi:hypothetical protein